MSKTYDIIEHLTMIHIEAKNDLAADGKYKYNLYCFLFWFL